MGTYSFYWKYLAWSLKIAVIACVFCFEAGLSEVSYGNIIYIQYSRAWRLNQSVLWVEPLMVVTIVLRVIFHFLFQLPVAQFQNTNMDDQDHKNQKKDDNNRHEFPSIDSKEIRTNGH